MENALRKKHRGKKRKNRTKRIAKQKKIHV